jgi:hypothetical protein
VDGAATERIFGPSHVDGAADGGRHLGQVGMVEEVLLLFLEGCGERR